MDITRKTLKREQRKLIDDVTLKKMWLDEAEKKLEAINVRLLSYLDRFKIKQDWRLKQSIENATKTG